DGLKLPEISILPPEHWSGTLEGLELSVLSGEQGQETWSDGFVFDLKVEPKADGIASFTPAPAFNDRDGIVHLNLNLELVDRENASVTGADDENVETVTLELSGLGKYAVFLVDGEVYKDVTYVDEGDGTYIFTGLSQAQVDSLAFAQTVDQLQEEISVKAWTVDGDDMSDPVSRKIPLTLVDRKPADGTDGDDIIVGTGGAETLIGGGGDDFIFGGEGDDLII